MSVIQCSDVTSCCVGPPHRQHGQDTVEELRSKDYKHSLERKEKEARDQRQRERTGRAFTGMSAYMHIEEKACTSSLTGWLLTYIGSSCPQEVTDTVRTADRVLQCSLVWRMRLPSHLRLPCLHHQPCFKVAAPPISTFDKVFCCHNLQEPYAYVLLHLCRWADIWKPFFARVWGDLL